MEACVYSQFSVGRLKGVATPVWFGEFGSKCPTLIWCWFIWTKLVDQTARMTLHSYTSRFHLHRVWGSVFTLVIECVSQDWALGYEAASQVVTQEPAAALSPSNIKLLKREKGNNIFWNPSVMVQGMRSLFFAFPYGESKQFISKSNVAQYNEKMRTVDNPWPELRN